MLDRTGDDGAANAGGALREALRRARAEAAGQTDVVVDMRHAEIARLEILRDELEQVVAQVPREIDIFDLGLTMGDRPRLFVDMVAFIEMGRDKRTYQFVRDGRHARTLIAESDRADAIVEAVTGYVARRLIERERILADDDRLAAMGDGAALAQPRSEPQPTPVVDVAPAPASAPAAAAPSTDVPAAGAVAAPAVGTAPAQAAPGKKGWVRVLKLLVAFAVGATIGAAVVLALIFAVAKGIIPL